ncbi:hypothetical protein [uncultured Traorella sp.]|uniref:hypothetical protein n=1 Tax=uncultured Traorella sp. TaxID=1929048 RepID=UPI0025E8370F|nr:hypothetical protein [uncultured Traorella sp.]
MQKEGLVFSFLAVSRHIMRLFHLPVTFFHPRPGKGSDKKIRFAGKRSVAVVTEISLYMIFIMSILFEMNGTADRTAHIFIDERYFIAKQKRLKIFDH